VVIPAVEAGLQRGTLVIQPTDGSQTERSQNAIQKMNVKNLDLTPSDHGKRQGSDRNA